MSKPCHFFLQNKNEKFQLFQNFHYQQTKYNEQINNNTNNLNNNLNITNIFIVLLFTY